MPMCHARWHLLVSILVLACVVSPALCRAQPASPPEAGPAQPYSPEQQRYTARLDQLLAGGDTRDLVNELLQQPDVPLAVAGLDWARAKLMAGAGLPIQLLYIQDLWRFGAMKATLKETASLITLYTLSVIFADGAKCEDKTATDAVLHRVARSLSFHDTLTFFKALPPDKQESYRAAAMRMEASIAPARQNDEYLCRWGAEAFADYAKKHGEAGVTSGPGGTRVVPIDPSYHPKFLAPSQWEAGQTAARQQLPRLLDGAIALATAPPP
jgi:hypothetical protein